MKRLAILLLFVPTAAHAAIRGMLIDEQAKPIAGATIRAYPAEGSREFRARVMRGAKLWFTLIPLEPRSFRKRR